MKKNCILWAVLAVLLSVILGNGASNVFAQTTLSSAKKDVKILVAYFPRADENYNVGVIEKRQYTDSRRVYCARVEGGYIPHSNH